MCWGSNEAGQLGGSSNTIEDAGPEFELQYVVSGAVAITAGAAHGCAIDAARALQCWGENGSGQVTGSASDPVAKPAMLELRATAVAAGGAHTCARVDDEGVYCWGSGRFGQSGREVTDGVLEPGLVAGTEAAVQISAGERHSCALLRDGTVRCWGALFDAQAGEVRAIAEPREVPELDDASEIAAGAGFTCARRESGAVVCWGNNASGELGDGTTESSERPVAVAGLELTLQLAAGGRVHEGQLVGHACAVTKSFLVQCWGHNAQGQAGQASASAVRRAAFVQSEFEQDEPYLDNVTKISAGGAHTCAIEEDGEVVCWGDDTFGQLGARETVYFGRPVEVRVFRGEFLRASRARLSYVLEAHLEP